MSTHNIQFHVKIKKNSLNVCYWKNVVGTKNKYHPRKMSHPCSSHQGFTVLTITGLKFNKSI